MDSLPLELLGIAWDPPSDPTLSHFQDYRLLWRPAQGSDDSFFGIEPESLFLAPRPPVPPESMTGTSGPWRQLAEWNARSIIDSLGEGWYRLRLVVNDSAGNDCRFTVTVQLLEAGTSLAGMTGGTTSGATSLTTTAEDNLYVGTFSGNLVEYTEDLDSTRAISLTDSAGPPVVSGVTTDSLGTIYVSDLRARDLKCYSEDGELEQTMGGGNQLAVPDDIAVAANGDVYTIDRMNCLVRVFDPAGELKRTFGGPGADTGQFYQPCAIALNHPRGIAGDTLGTYNTPPQVYIADKGNARVQVFDTAGRFLTVLGAGILAQPAAIALDSNNNCFIADVQGNAIYAFSPSGRHYLTIRSDDTLTPVATALSRDNGFIYTIDARHGTLAQYTVVYTDSTV